jgi:hypothetical protein
MPTTSTRSTRHIMYPPTPGATEPLLQEPDSPTNRLFFSYTGWVLPRRPRRLVTLCVVLATITLLGILFRSQRSVSFSHLDPDQPYPFNKADGLRHPFEQGSEIRPPAPPTLPPEIDPLDPRLFLRGSPTRKFRGPSILFSALVIMLIHARDTRQSTPSP